MLTFLFLVSLTATTTLLIVIAGEEVLHTTRRLLARRGAAGTVRSAATSSIGQRERAITPDSKLPQPSLRSVAQHTRVQPRGGFRNDEDQAA